jgi:aminoglycoside 6'-N-acetyltransferase I
MSSESIVVRMLNEADVAVLERVAVDVFDNEVRPALVREFLSDARHHLAVAIDEGVVVGMASAFHYVHPDKPAQMFINEVGVAPTHHRRGLGRRLVDELLRAARKLGCTDAWVATEVDNVAARRLYTSTGGVEDEPRACVYLYKLE